MRLVELKVEDIMSKGPVTIKPEQTISEALGIMKRHKISTLPVVRKNELRGIVTYRNIMEGRLNPSSKIRNAMQTTPIIHVKDPLVIAAHKISVWGTKAVPVLDEKRRIVGILARHDIVRAAAESDAFKEKKVENYMKKPVLSIREDKPVSKAREIMLANNIRRLPIVDKKGKLSGIVTLTDIAQKFYIHEKEKMTKGELTGEKVARLSAPVVGIMTKGTHYVKRGESLDKAADLLAKHNISGIPVVDENEFILGIITQADVTEEVAKLVKPEEYPIQIQGVEEVGPFISSLVARITKDTASKISKMMNMQYLKLIVKAYEEEGLRKKFSVSVNFQNNELFITKAIDWDLVKAVKEALSKLEENIIESKKKKIADRR